MCIHTCIIKMQHWLRASIHIFLIRIFSSFYFYFSLSVQLYWNIIEKWNVNEQFLHHQYNELYEIKNLYICKGGTHVIKLWMLAERAEIRHCMNSSYVYINPLCTRVSLVFLYFFFFNCCKIGKKTYNAKPRKVLFVR